MNERGNGAAISVFVLLLVIVISLQLLLDLLRIGPALWLHSESTPAYWPFFFSSADARAVWPN